MLFDQFSNSGSLDGASAKIILDPKVLKSQVMACRQLGAKVVVTIGSWDMLHIGHLRYLMRARSLGDILVVGVDTDRAIKLYKGPNRPITPEEERLEMLSYQQCVTFATTIDDISDHGTWRYALIRLLKPEIFVAVEGSYPERQRRVIERYSGELVVLPRQAENTSTSQIIQTLLKGQMAQLLSRIGGDAK